MVLIPNMIEPRQGEYTAADESERDDKSGYRPADSSDAR